MSFVQELKLFSDKANAAANAVTRKVVQDVGTALVLNSPVGDGLLWASPPPPGYVGGRFRGNWQFGIGEINTATDGAIDPTGANSIGRIAEGIPAEAAGKVYYLTNSLPYAIALENGHSTQAPLGMVGLTVLKFEPIVKAAAAAIGGLK